MSGEGLSGLTALEKVVSVFSPGRARAMALTRFQTHYAGQYKGARTDRTALRNFNPNAGSADSDSLGDLETLRARARDLARNAPIARGARNTTKTNVIGSGLRLSARLQREVLGLSDEQAEAWEDYAEVLFDLWASSKFCDVTRVQNFYELQALAFTAAWDSGDCFITRRYKEGGSFLALCLQMLEADRACTPSQYVPTPGGPDIRDGIEVDSDGEAVAVHFLNQHPGEKFTVANLKPESWVRVKVRGDTGLPLVLHLYERDRIGQTRGIPALAPVIEALKQLDRYAEAELDAAVVSAFFTVFIATEGGGTGEGIVGLDDDDEARGEVTLGSGTIIEGAPGEKPEVINPNRPNANFDPFFLAVIRQIGIALGIPYEVLIMHFSSSYTASKAAIETARQFFVDRRAWLARNFCQPVYEWFLYEAVTRGLLKAPGFLDDPVKRMAWCGSEWIGRAPIVLDAVKDAKAATEWLSNGARTLEQVTVESFGTDWWRNQEQRGREVALRRKLKLESSVPKDEPKPTDGGSAGQVSDNLGTDKPAKKDGDGDGQIGEGSKPAPKPKGPTK